jgi:hypothetical protein
MDMYVSLDPRRSERPLVELAALVDHPRSGRRFAAEVVELSCEGCRLLTREPVECGDQVLVSIAGLAQWPARVIWARGGAVGVEFHRALRPGIVARYAESFPTHLRTYTETLRLDRRERAPAEAAERKP